MDTHVGAIGGAPPPGGVSAARLGVGAADGCAAVTGCATPAAAVAGGAAALIAAPPADSAGAAGLAAAGLGKQRRD